MWPGQQTHDITTVMSAGGSGIASGWATARPQSAPHQHRLRLQWLVRAADAASGGFIFRIQNDTGCRIAGREHESVVTNRAPFPSPFQARRGTEESRRYRPQTPTFQTRQRTAADTHVSCGPSPRRPQSQTPATSGRQEVPAPDTGENWASESPSSGSSSPLRRRAAAADRGCLLLPAWLRAPCEHLKIA